MKIDPCPNKIHSHNLPTRMSLQPAVFAHKFRIRQMTTLKSGSVSGIEIVLSLNGVGVQLNHRAKIRTLLVLSAAEVSGVEGPG